MHLLTSTLTISAPIGCTYYRLGISVQSLVLVRTTLVKRRLLFPSGAAPYISIGRDHLEKLHMIYGYTEFISSCSVIRFQWPNIAEQNFNRVRTGCPEVSMLVLMKMKTEAWMRLWVTRVRRRWGGWGLHNWKCERSNEVWQEND